MGTKLYATTMAILICAMTAGCGGRTDESLHADAQPRDVTVTGGSTQGGPAGVATSATPADVQAREPRTDLQPLPEDAPVTAAGTTPEGSPPDVPWVPPHCSGRSTKLVKVVANLDSDARAINTASIVGPPAIAANPWDPQDPANTANFSTTMTIYDSLGTSHTLDIYFRKSDTEANTWDYHLLVPGADVVGGIPGANFDVGTGGTLMFTSDGALHTISSTTATIDFGNSTVRQTFALDFGEPIGEGGTGLDGTTAMPRSSNVKGQTQDGAPPRCFGVGVPRHDQRRNASVGTWRRELGVH